jgi:hypothetical protein
MSYFPPEFKKKTLANTGLSIGPSMKDEVISQGAVCLSPQWLVNISEACSLCLAVCVSCCIGFSFCKVIILGPGSDLTLRSYIPSAEETFLSTG